MQKYADTETVQVAGPQDLSKYYLGSGIGSVIGAGIGALVAAKQRNDTKAYLESLIIGGSLGGGIGSLLATGYTGNSKDSYWNKIKKINYGMSPIHHPMTFLGRAGGALTGGTLGGSIFGLPGAVIGVELGTGLGSYLTEKYYYGNK